MSYTTPLPSNPSLIALLFFIRTRTGPRFVCHYPPRPELTWQHMQTLARHPAAPDAATAADDDTSSAGSSSAMDDDDDEHASDVGLPARLQSVRSARSARSGSARSSGRRRLKRESGLGEGDDAEEEAGGLGVEGEEDVGASMEAEEGANLGAWSDAGPKSGAPEETKESPRGPKAEELLGYDPEGLAKLLCPSSRKWHKQKFELTLDELVFVSCPMFARGSAGWTRKKRGRNKGMTGSATLESEIQETKDDSGAEKLLESEGFRPAVDLTPQEKVDAAKGGSDDMTMYNVVFVMRPRYSEHTLRIKEMFDNVIKTLARALTYQQRAEAYVWNEARNIISIRDKLKATGATFVDIWPSIAANSSLATALATTFDSISTSKIAILRLGPSLDVSLQIPQPSSTRFAPTPDCKQIPGLSLTSFNAFDESVSNGPHDISPYCAILLLRSPGTLLKEIESDTSKELSASLSFFIRNCRSTKSLLKLSKICRLPLRDVQFLSSHLIHWRRARAIPPLHTKQIYIVSPNADFSHLAKSSANFSRRFAALPSLEAMLGKIGRSPKEWATFIPSKDHKAAYMDILAWLIREGWVTPLRTFAWIRVSVDVKLAVEEKILEEEREAAAAEAVEVADDDDTRTEDDMKSTLTVRRISGESRESKMGTLRMPRFTSTLYPQRPSSDAGSVSSARTAVAISAPGEQSGLRSKTGLFVDRSPQRPGSRQSNVIPNTLDHQVNGEHVTKLDSSKLKPSVIISPHKANALESRWIEHMGNSLDDVEVCKAWPSLTKYFDGKCALEDIGAREGLKRVVVSGWLSNLIDRNFLMVVRHW